MRRPYVYCSVRPADVLAKGDPMKPLALLPTRPHDDRLALLHHFARASRRFSDDLRVGVAVAATILLPVSVSGQTGQLPKSAAALARSGQGQQASARPVSAW